MSYNTRQRELILDYIKKNAKKHLTADDIADALKAERGRQNHRIPLS